MAAKYTTVLMALAEVHPVEAELAKKLLEPFRADGSTIILGRERADVLEMRICEALVKSHEAGVYDASRNPNPPRD